MHKKRTFAFFSPDDLAIHRKLGLVFTTNHSLLKKKRWQRESDHNRAEQEFCIRHRLTSAFYARLKEIYKEQGEEALATFLTKYRNKMIKMEELIDFFNK